MTARPTARQIATPLARPVAGSGDGGAVTPLLLDTYTGAAVAKSLRKLSNSSTNCIRVRRSSDNTEQDIGFSGVALDTTALLSFAGAGSAFVTTVYDQSGNNNHSTQATTTNQPRIVNAGVLDVENSLAAMIFDGVNDRLGFTGVSMASMFLVARQNSTTQNAGHYVVAGTGCGVSFGGSDASSTGILYLDGTSVANSLIENTLRHLVSLFASASPDGLFVDGVERATTAILPATLNTIGTRPDFATIAFPGSVQELIIWTNDQKSNRAAIETNINSYWGVY